MRSVLVVLAAIAATVVAGGPAAAQNFRKAPAADLAARLRIDPAQADAARGGTKVYVVQMAAKPAVSYEGGVAGLAKTAPAKGQRYDARSSQAHVYTEHLAAQQDALLASIGAGHRKIYSYRHALNGFAAHLTAAQAAKLRKNKNVLNVWEDRKIPVDTNNTPRFLGLRNDEEGLRDALGLRGRGVIIGVMDSGVVQEHPSYDDTGINPPKNWNGICQAGEAWAADDCNNKLIGSRYFFDGFVAGAAFEDVMVPGEIQSGRDTDGHGSHTSTTAAGRRVQASMGGTPLAFISGMAPHAHIANYKVCWQEIGAATAGCAFSDSAAATEAAIADGVDILTFSVGTAFAFTDPQDLAFLSAIDANVFVARSAGNEGPGPGSTAAGEPWVTTVAASTHTGTGFALAARINSPAPVAGDFPALEGAITKPLAETGPITNDVIAANPLDACAPIVDVAGKIVLIIRGTCTFVEKVEAAVAAGASAVLMYTNILADGTENPKVVMGIDPTPLTQMIPGVMIDNAPGAAIQAQLATGGPVNATLAPGIFITEELTGNIMAGFSSRGPYPIEPDWIKPDITAPGVQVLAGDTPNHNDGSPGGFFQYLQGTSMSTPHIAGIAALLKQKHPRWTPAQIKSALMTTARRGVVKEDQATPADPFDFGAGHVDPNEAIDPGLTYDAGLFDYLGASCGTVTPLVSPEDCATLESLGFSNDPANLNVASIGASEVLGTKTIRRTVTNVGPYATYEVAVTKPPGFQVQVNPRSLRLHRGESKSYEVTFTNVDAPQGEWRFGRLAWRDDEGHVVRSPIAVNAKLVSVPGEIVGEGADGSTSFDVAFGYTGPYTAGAHGLVEPFLTGFVVEDDPFDSFDFDFGPDEPIVYFADLPPGTTYAQWSLFDAYNDNPTHDIDLYLFYCPDFFCTQIDQSFTFTSNERVSVRLPLSDPTIDDPYIVFAHGFETAGGADATSILFDWTVLGPEGNMTATGPASAVVGQTGTVDVAWTGLLTGPAEKQVGAVSHSDATGIQGLTIVNIANDAGGGFCDLLPCGP